METVKLRVSHMSSMDQLNVHTATGEASRGGEATTNL